MKSNFQLFISALWSPLVHLLLDLLNAHIITTCLTSVCLKCGERRNGECEKLPTRTLKEQPETLISSTVSFYIPIWKFLQSSIRKNSPAMHMWEKSKFLNAKLIVNSIFVYSSASAATERNNTKLQGNIMQNGIMI